MSAADVGERDRARGTRRQAVDDHCRDVIPDARRDRDRGVRSIGHRLARRSDRAIGSGAGGDAVCVDGEGRSHRVARDDAAERIRADRADRAPVDKNIGDMVPGSRRDVHGRVAAPVHCLAGRRDPAVRTRARRDRVRGSRRDRSDVVPVHVVGRVTEVVRLKHEVVEPDAPGHALIAGEGGCVHEVAVDVVADRRRIELDPQVVPPVIRESGREADAVPFVVVPRPEPGAVDEADDRVAGDAAAGIDGSGPEVRAAVVHVPVGPDVQVR